MNEKEDSHSIVDVLKAKYLELKDSNIGKYFFLYFLHLMGFFEYREENNESIYSSSDTVLRVPLPIIDSSDKYHEMEQVHKNLEGLSEYLKKQGEVFSDIKLTLLESI